MNEDNVTEIKNFLKNIIVIPVGLTEEHQQQIQQQQQQLQQQQLQQQQQLEILDTGQAGKNFNKLIKNISTKGIIEISSFLIRTVRKSKYIKFKWLLELYDYVNNRSFNASSAAGIDNYEIFFDYIYSEQKKNVTFDTITFTTSKERLLEFINRCIVDSSKYLFYNSCIDILTKMVQNNWILNLQFIYLTMTCLFIAFILIFIYDTEDSTLSDWTMILFALNGGFALGCLIINFHYKLNIYVLYIHHYLEKYFNIFFLITFILTIANCIVLLIDAVESPTDMNSIIYGITGVMIVFTIVMGLLRFLLQA